MSQDKIGRNIENPLIVIKIIKFKKPNLTKVKKSNLIKANKLDSKKIRFYEKNYFILKAKKILIHL